MNHIQIDKLRIRLKNVPPEKVQEALPGAWKHLKNMIAGGSLAQSSHLPRFFASVHAGNIDSRRHTTASLSVQIAEKIYHSITTLDETRGAR